MLTKLELKIAELGFVFMLLLGAYFWVGHNAVENYKEDQAVKQAVVDKAQQAKYDKLAADYEAAKANREVVFKTLTNTVERVVEKPVYKVQCIDSEGVEVANKALAGAL